MYRWNTADRRGTALRISVEKWGKGNEGRAKYNQLDYARNERGRGENAMGEGKNEIEISRHIVHIFHRLWNNALPVGRELQVGYNKVDRVDVYTSSNETYRGQS